MPDSLHPPFLATAQLSPRQISRWLDVNPQGGPLKRIQTTITLPTFTQAAGWQGYSEIVVAFPFAAPNNFTLTDLSDLPTDPNYVLCIAYQEDGIVSRYKLCGPAGVFFFTLVQYTNQLIKKNFWLEVWSIADANVSEATARSMITSKRGDKDYRWSDDVALASASSTITDFQSPQGSGVVPTADNRWRADQGYDLQGGSAATWTDINAAVNFVRTGASDAAPPAPIVGYANNTDILKLFAANEMTASGLTLSGDPSLFFIISIATHASNGEGIKIDNGIFSISVNFGASGGGSSAVTLTSTAGPPATGTMSMLVGEVYIMEIRSGFLFLYPITPTGQLGPAQTLTGVITPDGAGTIIVTLSAVRQIYYHEILMYSTTTFNAPVNYCELFQYLSTRYDVGMFDLPLTFPAAIPTNP